MLKSDYTSNIDTSNYVVLDVETNGLSSIRHDLLSISIYKPDTGEIFNRFLPLELNSTVDTTEINGITAEDLQDKTPLSQNEVDEIIKIFELKNRIILTYGNIDEKFIIKYFQRHNLQGIDYFAFYNFKNDIISSCFSEGNITKDNLCRLYGIENVQRVHSGSNDCILEWNLFKQMNGHKLLITNNKVFEFNNDYIVPASFLSFYPNLKKYIPNLPTIKCNSEIVFSFPISIDNLKKFPTNFNGMMIEHVINSMLQVQRVHSENELIKNKRKLKYIGKLPSKINTVPMIFNRDGSMTATRSQDKSLEKQINTALDIYKATFEPIVSFIRDKIFSGEQIFSQELVVNKEKKILACCDLSTDKAVLEIKANSSLPLELYANQLFYESNGRKCYILRTTWNIRQHEMILNIYEVKFDIKEYVDPVIARLENAKKKIETQEIELLSYTDSKSPVKLKCKKCGHEWNTNYSFAIKHRPCPICNPKPEKRTSYKKQKTISPKTSLSKEDKMILEQQKRIQKLENYQAKIDERSNHKLQLVSFTDTRSQARVKCLVCDYEWETRADHLLYRSYCPVCKKKGYK